MIRWLESRVLWGALLILGGVMFLLQNLGVFEFGDLFWALLFGLAGLFFISVFIQNQANWWALIPGFTLASIGLLIALSSLSPATADIWGGLIILGGIGASFLVIYLVDRRNWWAIIPAGVLLTLAVIASLSDAIPGLETGGILFIGIGLTFVLLGMLPGQQGQLRWAWIPAGILLVMGILFMAAAGELIAYIWPLALILGGGLLILRTLFPRAR